MNSEKNDRREVKRAAAISVIAAAFLTLIKLIVGIMDGSLGILSESLHSGLDLLAAGITMIAVSRAARAPDDEHPYGHGKIENFSAFIESVLLWITAAWIIFEAFRRMETHEVANVSILGIGVMITSIIIDWERSRVLYRAAKEYGSQALEADALHFRTDMISSVVVLLGLGFVALGVPIADPLAAIGVAIVIIVISLQLAKRVYDDLVDTAPKGVRAKIEEICRAVPGVIQCDRVRSRMSGPFMFVDVIVQVDENIDMSQAERIADAIEDGLKVLAPTVDVLVQMKPYETGNIMSDERDVYAELEELTRREASITGVHKVRILSRPDGTHIAADLEMQSDLTLEEAHQTSETLESELRTRVPNVSRITFHLESMISERATTDVTHEKSNIGIIVKDIVENQTPAQDCHNLEISEENEGLVISFDCRLDGSIPLSESHRIAELIEQLVMKEIKGVQTVIVHMEPL